VRLYALPDLTLAGEFSNSEGACFSDSNAREPMLFSNDGKSLWLVCGQYTVPTPDDPMAIRLDVPAMKVRDIRRYGGGAESGGIGGLERIGGSVWAWQSSTGKPFRISDLTDEREIVTAPTPTQLIGRLTEQTGITKVDEKTIRRVFCGVPPGAPAGAGLASWICRTLSFDTRTGALLGSVDKSDHRILNDPPRDLPNHILSGHGLSIESFWRQDSKAGELVVRNSATGRERQRIASIAQRPLQMSADGVWLMTSAVHGGGLRLYSIHR
jgi:hypothetical protein